MRPWNSRRSVPVLMPLQSMSTTTSASPGAVSPTVRTARSSGLFSTTANASILEPPGGHLDRVPLELGVNLNRLSCLSTAIYTQQRGVTAGFQECTSDGAAV